MTAPEHRSGGLDANARGILVLVVAVAIAGLLLVKTGDSGAKSHVATGVTTTTVAGSGTTIDTSGITSTTVSGSAHTPGEVSVIVLNGSGKVGVAKSNSDTLGRNHGYTMQLPGNAAANAPSTVVYYATGFQADAVAVANALGVASSSVAPKPTTSLGATTGGANTRADKADVVVVLGANTPNVSSSTTTSTTAVSGSVTTTTA